MKLSPGERGFKMNPPLPTIPPFPNDANQVLKGDRTWGGVPGGSGSWGQIGGNISSQTDLQTVLNAKLNVGFEAFPVGSVFISVVATNPSVLLGYGTWAAFAAGKVLIGLDPLQTEFNTVEQVGGEKTHVLTQTEMPSHTHIQDPHNHTQNAHTHTQNSHTHPSIQVQGGTTAATTGTHIMTSTATGGSSRAAITPEAANAATAVNQSTTPTNNTATATNQNIGSDGAHNNLQPYIVVYIWKRTA